MPQSQARLAPAQYTFAPSSKQISFAGVPGFVLDGLIEVFHVPSGSLLFDAYDPAVGGTVSGNVLTLAYDTTAMSAGDALRIIYNDLTREDRLLVYNPTATGALPVIALGAYQTLIVEAISTTDVNWQVEASLDGVNWKTGSGALNGRIVNLYNNPGSQTGDRNTPFNTRQYDVSAFLYVRVNITLISAGTPKINVVLKTAPAPWRDVYIQGGALGVSLNGSTAQIGYLGVGQAYSDSFSGALAANATLNGTPSSRDSLFSPLAYNRYGVFVSSDQAGQVFIEVSTNNSTWVLVDQRSVVAATPVDFSVPVRARYYRTRYVNGATAAAALTVLSSFSGAA